jgi:hypothetical protein
LCKPLGMPYRLSNALKHGVSLPKTPEWYTTLLISTGG